MLFITNRVLNEGKESVEGRSVSFRLEDNEAEQSVYFCQRQKKNTYVELMSGPFLDQLKASNAEQLLIYIHGYSNMPEPKIFPRAQKLQALFDKHKKGMVTVIPLIWPCDNDPGKAKDYWDDQKAADASAFAFARLLEKFIAWRGANQGAGPPCTKRINILAHSMGNRVLRETMVAWARYYRPDGLPLLFRNTFLMAADVVNEALERGQAGELICDASRNVGVYFASDDLALRSSKVANLANQVASRRLGHTGPENMDAVPQNVYAIDCDEVNTRYDFPTGHSYFLTRRDGKPGSVFKHLCGAVDSGRIPVGDDFKERQVVLG